MTKQEAALDAGYSQSQSRVPAQIEASRGYNIAMAGIAGQAGNLASEVMHTLKARDLTKEDTKTLVYSLDIISKAFERFTPKQKALTPQEFDDMDAVFSRIIPVEAVDITTVDGAESDTSQNDHLTTLDTTDHTP